ncbi:MAG: alpha/beta hydrolase [Pseudomonadota bacterium]
MKRFTGADHRLRTRDRLLILALALAALTGCAPARHWEAALVLADVAAVDSPSRLKTNTAAPTRAAVAYTVAGRERTGDLYSPGEGAPRAGLVLVPGAVPLGKDDPRIVAFAQTLARARFAVLVPEIPGFRQLRMHSSDARVVADAFVWLAGRDELAPAGRVGLAAFSYGVGPAVLAALEEDAQSRARFIVGVGGYYDLSRAIRYFTTGYYRAAGEWRYLRPDDYGKLVLVHSAVPYLSARDGDLLKAMAERRLQDRAADITDLAARLGREGRAVFDLIENTDPEAFPRRYAALPARLRADLAALSLHDKDLGGLSARLILLHGRNDTLIPWPESLALAAALPPSQGRVFLLDAVLGHVDLSLSHILSWQFLTVELPDIVRMWRAVDALLAERARNE